MWRRRPYGVTVLVVVIIAVVAVAWKYFSGPSSSDCAPVQELLAFNKTQIDAMNAKTHDPEAGSYAAATEPSESDYRAWADGLADRAAKVTATDLAGQARDVAQTVQRLVGARIDYDAQSKRTAPGGTPPPVGMAVIAFNDQYESQIKQLAATCEG